MASQMTIRTKISIITILLVFTISSLPVPVNAAGSSLTLSELPGVEFSADSGENEQGVLLRLSIDNLITLQIVQQPVKNSNFVTPLSDSVTEYKTASNFGTVGLLAHNYLAGRYFFQISPGQKIELVYSDNKTKSFVVTEIQRYQALVPDSPSSDFNDLTSGEYLTASQLFNKVYRNQKGHLVLQTCISAGNNSSWGRLFIIAKPAS